MALDDVKYHEYLNSGLSPLAAATLASDGGGGSGGTILGPYDVDYTTPGISDGNPGAVLPPTLPAGTIIRRAWLATTTTWVGSLEGARTTASVGVCVAADPTSDSWDVVVYKGSDPAPTLIYQIGDDNFLLETDLSLDVGDVPTLTTSQLPAPTVCRVAAKAYVMVFQLGGSIIGGAGSAYLDVILP